MINIFHDKFDKVSCAMTAKKPAKKVCCQSEFLVYSFSLSTDTHTEAQNIARENCRLSTVLTTWDILPGEMSAPQQQNLDNDDINQSLHN